MLLEVNAACPHRPTPLHNLALLFSTPQHSLNTPLTGFIRALARSMKPLVHVSVSKFVCGYLCICVYTV